MGLVYGFARSLRAYCVVTFTVLGLLGSGFAVQAAYAGDSDLNGDQETTPIDQSPEIEIVSEHGIGLSGNGGDSESVSTDPKADGSDTPDQGTSVEPNGGAVTGGSAVDSRPSGVCRAPGSSPSNTSSAPSGSVSEAPLPFESEEFSEVLVEIDEFLMDDTDHPGKVIAGVRNIQDGVSLTEELILSQVQEKIDEAIDSSSPQALAKFLNKWHTRVGWVLKELDESPKIPESIREDARKVLQRIKEKLNGITVNWSVQYYLDNADTFGDKGRETERKFYGGDAESSLPDASTPDSVLAGALGLPDCGSVGDRDLDVSGTLPQGQSSSDVSFDGGQLGFNGGVKDPGIPEVPGGGGLPGGGDPSGGDPGGTPTVHIPEAPEGGGDNTGGSDNEGGSEGGSTGDGKTDEQSDQDQGDQGGSDDSEDGDGDSGSAQDCPEGGCGDDDGGGGDESNPNPFEDFPTGCVLNPACLGLESEEDKVSNPWDLLDRVLEYWGDGEGPGGPVENPGDIRGIDGGDIDPEGPGGPVVNPGDLVGDWTDVDDLGGGGPVQQILDAIGFEEDEDGNPIGPPQPQVEATP